MSQANLTSVIEAAYSLPGDDDTWLNALCRTARPLIDMGLGAAGLLYDVTRDDYTELNGVCALDVDQNLLSGFFSVPEGAVSESRRIVDLYRTRHVGAARGILEDVPGIAQHAFSRLAQAGYANADMFGVIAPDPLRHGCALVAFSEQPIAIHPRTVARWSRVAAHISTGWRLRQRLRALETAVLPESPEAEAIFESDGRPAHASGVAKSTEARERLRGAMAAFERARRSTSDPDEALMLWEALVDGRWSLLDCFDRDGRRYWVAHRNDPTVPEVNPLTERERQVAAYAALGQSNKLIAYELGVSLATVNRVLRTVRAKLGVGSRVELVNALRPARISVGSDGSGGRGA